MQFPQACCSVPLGLVAAVLNMLKAMEAARATLAVPMLTGPSCTWNSPQQQHACVDLPQQLLLAACQGYRCQ